jgi:hypothetical protein
MGQSRQAARVQPGATAKVENPRRIPFQDLTVNPPTVAINDLETATGRVVLLGQMDVEHASTEVRFIPRDLLSLSPRFGNTLPAKQIHQLHCVSLLDQLNRPDPGQAA